MANASTKATGTPLMPFIWAAGRGIEADACSSGGCAGFTLFGVDNVGSAESITRNEQALP